MFRHRRPTEDHSETGAPSTSSATDPPVAELPTRAMVLSNDPVASEPGRSVVRVQVPRHDGTMGEFSQQLATLYQPPADSPEGQELLAWRTSQHLKHADRVPKIQLPLFAGCLVPVTIDPEDATRLVIDELTLQKRAVHDYLHDQRSQQARQAHRATEKASKTKAGPPWKVPIECPNCGARVDQAVATQQADPHCAFCREPLPVTPQSS